MPVAAKVSLGARPLTVVTPLGADVLLLAALSGHEEISHLFRFTLSVTASADEEIAFDKLLGQTFRDAVFIFDTSTLMGVVTAEQEILLPPPFDRVFVA